MKLEKIKKQFEKDGFVVIKNFYSLKIYDELKKVFSDKLNFYSKKNIKINSFDNNKIHRILTKLRRSNPKKFSYFYDSLQECNALNKIFINKKLEHLVSYLINTKDYGLSISGKMLRMDSYFDNKSSYNWHQDYPYYKQNKNPSNGCVVFLPLQNIKIKDGALEIIKSSQKSNLSKHYVDKRTNRLLIKNDKKIQNKKTTFLEYNIGDVAIMHLGLIHRSGKNNSLKFRLTAGVRYHSTLSKDFNPFRSNFTISS